MFGHISLALPVVARTIVSGPGPILFPARPSWRKSPRLPYCEAPPSVGDALRRPATGWNWTVLQKAATAHHCMGPRGIRDDPSCNLSHSDALSFSLSRRGALPVTRIQIPRNALEVSTPEGVSAQDEFFCRSSQLRPGLV